MDPSQSDHNQESNNPFGSEDNKEEEITILLISDDFEKVFLAFMLAMSARSMNMQVNIFFALWGINLLRRNKDQPPLEPENDEEIRKKSIMMKMMAMMMPKGPSQVGLSKRNFAGLGASMMKNFMKESGAASLPELMDMAVEAGVRFTVCSLTMEIMGFSYDDLIGLPNLACGGITSCLGDALKSRMFLVI